MLILEILIILFVGFLVFKFILMPKFSTKKVDISEIPQEFEDVYNKFKALDFSEINEKKKKLVFYSIAIVISFIAFLMIFIFTYLKSLKLGFSLIPLIFLAVFIVLFLLEFKKFKLLYTNVVRKFIQLINPNLNYNNTSFTNEEKYYQSACFDDLQLNSFIAKDTISGQSNDNYKFYASNISVTTTTENVFNGIFSTVILDKNIPSYTKINTENLEYITTYALGATNSYLKYIEMDNADFNKVLHVYSNDRLNATEILTSDILDYLCEFYNKYHVNFQIVFTGNYVYSRFFITQLFVPSFIGNLFNKSNFALCYVIITFIIEIIEKLSNNMSNFEE